MKKNKPILYDPMIINRVKQYLEENVDQTYLNIGEMARNLKERHWEYRRRKMAPFRSLVHQAYRIVSQSYNLEAKEIEQNSTSDVELMETEPPSQPPNLLNNLMSDLYSRQSQPRLQVPINEPTAEPKRPIGIKGDESSGGTKRIGENVEGQSKRKRVKSPKNPPLKSSQNPILCPERKARATAAALIQKGKKKQKIGTKCFVHSQSTFDDVIGMDSTIKELCKVLVFFKHREIFEKPKIQPPSGILLHGPAGCGKTFVAKCIAGHLGIPLMELSAVELLGGIGVAGEAKCRNIFDKAVNMQPCMIFIDDFDRAASNRTSAQRDGERRLVHQISNWMDEIRSNKLKILVVGATTQLDLIDPTLRKTGRFDNDVGIGILNRTGRLEILKHIAKKLNLGEDFPCERLAALTPGFVPADLNSLIGRSTLIALKRFWSKVTKEAFPKTPLEEEIVDLVEDSNSSEDSRSASPETLTEKSEKSTRDSEKDKNEHDTLGNAPCVNTDESGMSDQSKSINIMKDLTITEIETKEDDIYYTEEPTERLPEFDSEDWQKMLFAEWKSLMKLGTFKITIDDFVEALKYVKPLSKKEGFITVPNVSWKDVGSLKVLRDELRLAVAAPVKYPDRLEMLGLTAPTGILLYGPPGCGKTLLAKAIANEAGVNFISVKGPELLSMYVGESERAVRLCFQRAKNSAPCVIFFDEFDALCPKRTHKPESSASGVRIVNQLLTEMDGVEERKDVFVLAATNRPDIIDPAVLRPGRLDKMLFVGLPNVDDRNDILLTLTKKGKKPLLDNSVDIHQLAEKTEGFTGADLAGLLREAAHATLLACMLSTKDQSDVLSIKWEHFEKAFETVTPSVTAEDLKHYDKFKDSYLKRNACNQEF